MERETGFEPATSSLARKRSTTELLSRRNQSNCHSTSRSAPVHGINHFRLHGGAMNPNSAIQQNEWFMVPGE